MRGFGLCFLLILSAVASAVNDYTHKSTWYLTSQFDAAYTAVTSDGVGNVYAAGYSMTSSTLGDVWLRKVNSAGTSAWNVRVANGLRGPIFIKRIVLDSTGNPHLLIRSISSATTKPAMTYLKASAVNGSLAYTATYNNADPGGIAVIGDGSAGTRLMVAYTAYDPNSSTIVRWATVLRTEGSSTWFSNSGSYDGSRGEDVIAGPNEKFYFLRTWTSGCFLSRHTGINADDISAPLGTGVMQGGRLAWNIPTGEIGVVMLNAPNTNPNAFVTRIGASTLDSTFTSTGELNSAPSAVTFQPDGSLLYFGRALLTNSSAAIYRYYGDPVSGMGTIESGYDADARGVAISPDRFAHFAYRLIQPQGADSILGIKTQKPGSPTYSFQWSLTPAQPHAVSSNPAGDIYIAGKRRYFTNIPADAGCLLRLIPKAVAIPNSYETPAGTNLNVSAPGVLGNDFGITGATLSWGNPLHGTLTPSSTGGFSYVPDQGFVGSDTFTYSLAKQTLTSTGTVSVRVQPRISAVTAPTTITGGEPATGTVTLAGIQQQFTGYADLSDNSTAVALPSSVSIQPGNSSGSFVITTVPVTSNRNAVISATRFNETKTVSLQVLTARPLSVVLNPNTLVGGQSFVGTVMLTGKAPTGGLTVTLTDSGEYIEVPVNVVVAAGSKTGTFNGTTSPRSQALSRSVTGTLNGGTATGSLMLNPGGLFSVLATPSTFKGGTSSVGKVTTAGVAPAGGILSNLSVNGGNVTIPATATIAAGANQATFTIGSTAVATNTPRTITATWASVTKTTTITLTP